ncbi:MAG: DUF3365 domain-containing protein [Mariprofundaceae bacterium]|nr:DUF3365 domain-containing protein [Mariprofundaceae bacterium]
MLFRLMCCLCCSLLFSACQDHVTFDARQQDDLQKEAMSVVQKFAGTLKPQLKQALKEAGPEYAIEVCSKEAPKLARALSEKTGWQIKRVSLKARNHHAAQPDSWERKVLQQFEREQKAGISSVNMTVSHIEHGKFRLMKAQAVVPVCLICHGANISPDITIALKQYYPKDQATGYKLGQIRGAFSLTKQL